MKRTESQNIALIKKLSDAFGPPGFEDDVVEICAHELKDIATVIEDKIRNLHIDGNNNTGDKPVVWLDAHSDEVGFIIQAINPNGTIHFLPLGGWDPGNVPSNRLKIKNDKGEFITGVVASKPPHFMTEAEKGAKSLDAMRIDCGPLSAEELAENMAVGIGNPIIPDVTCEYNKKSKTFLGKAFDCRIGVAALLETFNQAHQIKDLPVDLIGTVSSQEEVGTRGILAASQVTDADVAIVFEGAPADDNFQPDYMVQAGLKKGPSLRYFDSTMVTNPKLMKFAKEVAEKYEIPIQLTVRSGGGTNARVIHTTQWGIPTIVIGIPVRYIHSQNGFVAYEDYENAVKLAVSIIRELSEEVVENL